MRGHPVWVCQCRDPGPHGPDAARRATPPSWRRDPPRRRMGTTVPPARLGGRWMVEARALHLVGAVLTGVPPSGGQAQRGPPADRVTPADAAGGCAGGGQRSWVAHRAWPSGRGHRRRGRHHPSAPLPDRSLWFQRRPDPPVRQESPPANNRAVGCRPSARSGGSGRDGRSAGSGERPNRWRVRQRGAPTGRRCPGPTRGGAWHMLAGGPRHTAVPAGRRTMVGPCESARCDPPPSSVPCCRCFSWRPCSRCWRMPVARWDSASCIG